MMIGQQWISIVTRSAAFGAGVGGMERAFADHVNWLVDEGLKVRVFTPARTLKGPVPDDVTIVDVPWPTWDRIRYLQTFGVAYLVWAEKVADVWSQLTKPGEIVHFHGASGGALAAMVKRGHLPLSVVNPHGMEEFHSFAWHRAPSGLVTRALARKGASANKIIATDRSMVAAVARNFGIPLQRVVVIPNVVDVEGLRSLAGSPTCSNRFRLVSVGRLAVNKGYDMLAEALGRVDVKSVLPRDFEWLHFGSGAARTNVEGLAAANGVRLKIIGGADDATVQSAVAAADIFVQPSRYEGSSLTTLEAMAQGRTVVASPVGGIPDKIIDEVTGFLASSASVPAIAKALIRAAAADRDEIGRAALAHVRANFDVHVAREAYRRLYEDLYRGVHE